jgi:membrane protein implicated in regulation of membrane protease activity
VSNPRSRTIASVVSAVSGILAGILGGWLAGRWIWGVAVGVLTLIAVVAGAEVVKVRAERDDDPKENSPINQKTSITLGKNTSITNSVVAAGNVEQKQVINENLEYKAKRKRGGSSR